eukprot:CAMPEP_0180685964 /NCGR_PEP_ID=MMETSP1037_2-20121125/72690_1 /TAXON_ID=632150 /ORGANISM="Azadinium spinosum, Strain 3D9" /LENGTH=36 /DNA_ID= /DNA_START= /DNA_END= /DNA_ORIENTATION=
MPDAEEDEVEDCSDDSEVDAAAIFIEAKGKGKGSGG